MRLSLALPTVNTGGSPLTGQGFGAQVRAE